MEKEELKKLLHYHLFDQTYGSGFFISGSLPTATVEGNFIQMDISSGIKNTILNNTIKVDSLDISATNGVVHVINDVLEPPTQTIYTWLKVGLNIRLCWKPVKRQILLKRCWIQSLMKMPVMESEP